MAIEELLVTALGVAALTFLFLFIPAAIEVFHPKDAGPRFISDKMEVKRILLIVNLEEETRIDPKLTLKLTGFLNTIPSIETGLFE